MGKLRLEGPPTRDRKLPLLLKTAERDYSLQISPLVHAPNHCKSVSRKTTRFFSHLL
jgi:hypothetical protein